MVALWRLGVLWLGALRLVGGIEVGRIVEVGGIVEVGVGGLVGWGWGVEGTAARRRSGTRTGGDGWRTMRTR